MTANEFDLLRADLSALRADVLAFRTDVDLRFARLESELNAKPGYAALYQAVVTLAFGIGAVVTSTVVVLKNIGTLP